MFHQAETSPKKFGLDLGFHNDLPIRLHLGNLGNEASIASEALNGSQANRSWNEVLTEAPSAFTAPLLEVTLGLFRMKVQIGISCDQWVEYDSSLVENLSTAQGPQIRPAPLRALAAPGGCNPSQLIRAATKSQLFSGNSKKT